MVEIEEEEGFSDIYVTFSVLVLNVTLLFYFVLI